MFGFVASTTSRTPFDSTPPQQLVDAQVARVDAVERRECAAEHVVQAAELGRALERDDVDRLLDDADQRVIAACIETDRARLLLGQVPALATEADALLDLLEGRGEGKRLFLRALQDVERKALSRPSADAWEAVSCATRFSTEGLNTGAHCARGVGWKGHGDKPTHPSARSRSMKTLKLTLMLGPARSPAAAARGLRQGRRPLATARA